MPTYVYECAKCGDEFELYQSFSDDPLKKHPGCGGKVAKVFQPVGIVLKGSGFYKNDSRSGAKSGGAKRERQRLVEVGHRRSPRRSPSRKSDIQSEAPRAARVRATRSSTSSDTKASTPAAKST